jgi:hypothetical protein
MDNELAAALAVTAEITGTDLSQGAAIVMAQELAAYDRGQVLGALKRCRRELRGRLTMAAVIERLDDGRPGPEEAWAMLPTDEASSVVWTDEMAEAFGLVCGMIEDGETVAARMAFKEKYLSLISLARDERKPVNWTPSLGHDPRSRDGALSLAVEKGRLTQSQALAYSPTVSIPMTQYKLLS